MKELLIRLLEPLYHALTRYMARAGLIQFAYGFAGHIGIAKETNWGSGVAVSSGDYIEGFSEDLSLTIERFSHKAIIASLSEPDDSTGLYRVEGSMRFGANPGQNLHNILRAALHSYDTTSATGPLYQYDFVTTSGGADFSTDVPIQPYTLEIFRDVTSSNIYTGCLLNALTFTFNPSGPVMCDATWIGRNAEVGSKSSPTITTTPAKPFNFATVSLSVGGAGTALIEELVVTVNNNLEGLGALNLSNRIAKVRRNNHQMVEISGTLDFANLTEYGNFVDQTEQRMTVSATAPASFGMVIDIPRVVYTAFPLGIPGRERITVGFTGKGFVHQGSGNAIKISLFTTQSMK